MSDHAAREDWRDWLPDGADEPTADALLTRDQVLAALHRRRVKATVDDLRFWERDGILPRPVRQWHEGAVRALYPPWYLDLVQQLRRMQRQGYPLAAIGRQLRAQWRERRGLGFWPPWRENLLSTSPALVNEMERFAAEYARLTGEAVARVVVRVETALGHTEYPLPVAAPPTESNKQ